MSLHSLSLGMNSICNNNNSLGRENSVIIPHLGCWALEFRAPGAQAFSRRSRCSEVQILGPPVRGGIRELKLGHEIMGDLEKGS